MEMLISLIVVTFHMYILSHRIVHLKFIQLKIVNYTSVKLGGNIQRESLLRKLNV